MTIISQVILPLLLLASPFVIVFILVNKFNPNKLSYKFAVALALITAFILIWVNLAVGIIGSPDNNANLMFFAILLIGMLGAIKVRFQSIGMSYVMLLLSLSLILIAAIDMIFRLGFQGPIWPFDTIGASCLLALLWFGSALLFRRAAQIQHLETLEEQEGCS